MTLALDDSHDLYAGPRSGIAVATDGAEVVQGVLTRLRMFRGEWALDVTAGTPWFGEILGASAGSLATAETVVKRRILEDPRVTAVTSLSLTYDPGTRSFSAAFEVSTEFGPSGVLGVEL